MQSSGFRRRRLVRGLHDCPDTDDKSQRAEREAAHVGDADPVAGRSAQQCAEQGQEGADDEELAVVAVERVVDAREYGCDVSDAELACAAVGSARVVLQDEQDGDDDEPAEEEQSVLNRVGHNDLSFFEETVAEQQLFRPRRKRAPVRTVEDCHGAFAVAAIRSGKRERQPSDCRLRLREPQSHAARRRC
ncbi:hypothetical protein BH10CYA1_BH10CYA1_41510 [soil metagenome]